MIAFIDVRRFSAVSAILFLTNICISELHGTSATTTPKENTSVSAAARSEDALTDLVTSFYSVLLQTEAPTAAQEQQLFDTTLDPAFHKFIKDQKQYAGSPAPVCQYFRDNKEWFFPKNMRSIKEINVSCRINFVRDLKDLKDEPQKDTGWVMVSFADDRKAVPARLRGIFFQIWLGKIDPADICLKGFGEGSTSSHVNP